MLSNSQWTVDHAVVTRGKALQRASHLPKFFDWMGEWVMAAQIFFVRAQAFCAVFNQLVRSSAQLLFLE